MLTEHGAGFLGLENSTAPELVERVRSLFRYLDGRLGFPDSVEGRKNQQAFNALLRSVYPEITIDIADIVYVQHERPAVFLNFDHIRMNLRKEGKIDLQPGDPLHAQMETLFFQFANRLKNSKLHEDPEVVRPLSESYSYYLHKTANFPWEDPLQMIPENPARPVMDIASGLAGFSMIHFWPDNYPKLVLTDKMPFILQGLAHYKELSGKKHVEILDLEFPSRTAPQPEYGCITANKFLHHLTRPERRNFLAWARDSLAPEGSLRILDTDMENRILRQAEDPEYRAKLIPGYAETLVKIENDFCKNLALDAREARLNVTHFDFHEYHDETDAYSRYPGDNIDLKFVGFEIVAENTVDAEPTTPK